MQSGYDQQGYAYMQQPAAAHAPPANGNWHAQYQTGTADYSAYPYAQSAQAAGYDALSSQQYASAAAAAQHPPPPPTEVPPPPPV